MIKVFLSHNSADKPLVEKLALQLRGEGLEPWLDKWDLIPGQKWQEGLEQALKASDVCLIFIGGTGEGPWHQAEIRVALDRNITQQGLRVIPVLLPNAPEDAISKLPPFLQSYNGVQFYNSLDEQQTFSRLVSGIRNEKPGSGRNIEELENPYRGLQYFDIEHAPFFFGRSDVTQLLLQIIHPEKKSQLQGESEELRFLAIIGASGSGKSSLARAGLFAALQNNALSESKDWPQLIFKPGEKPLQSLAVAINAHPDLHSRWTTRELIEKLHDEPKQLHDLGLEWLHGDEKRYLVILADQFEEIFTLCKDKKERQTLLENLLEAATESTGRIIVVLTLRADFYANCSAYSKLSRCLENQQYLLNPMEESELREAIIAPARQMGCELESGLIQVILQDVHDQPGSLPLLQYALMQLWEQRQSHTLRLGDYQRFGGLTGVLEQRASQIYEAFSPELQEHCRLVFRRLVQPGDGVADTRRRSKLGEFDEQSDSQQVIQVLTDARLLTTQRQSDSAFIEVSHEALIRGWSLLKEWIDQDREQLRLQHQISNAAQDWVEHNEEASWLLTGSRLVTAEEWLNNVTAGNANALEQRFIRSGVKQRDADRQNEQTQQHRLKWLVTALTLLMVVMIGVASYGFKLAREAEQAEKIAEESKQTIERVLLQVKEEQQRTTQALEKEKLATAEAKINFIHAKKKELQSNYNLAKALEEKANALYEKGTSLDVGSPERVNNLRQAILYTLEAQLLPIPKSKTHVTNDTFSRMSNLDINWLSPERKDLEGHLASVSTVVYSPDGKHIASGSVDKTIRLWDSKTGSVVKILEGHLDIVTSVAYSPDSKFIASGSADGSIRIWDAVSGKELKILKGHSGWVSSVTYSPQGKYIASSSGNSIRLWNASTSEPLKVIEGSYNIDTSVVFSPDGKYLASGSGNSVHLFDGVTGDVLKKLEGHSSQVATVAFSPDGKYLVSAGSYFGTVHLWDVTTAKIVKSLPGHFTGIYTVAYSPDGKFVAISTETRMDNNILLWDITSGKVVKVLLAGTSGVQSIAYSPDGKFIVSGSSDSTVRLWDTIDTNEVVKSIESGGILSYSPDSKYIATSAVWGGDAPDGKLSITYRNDNAILLRDITTGRVVNSLQGHDEVVVAVAYSPDGKLVLSSANDSVRLWNAITGELLKVIDNRSYTIESIAFSPNSKVIALGEQYSGTIVLRDISTGETLKTMTGKYGWVESIAYSPDGNFLASVPIAGDFPVHLWNVKTGESVNTFYGHSDFVRTVAYSPDGKHIASGSHDKTIRIWNTETGSVEKILDGHLEKVTIVVYSPDGKIIASGSDDKTVRLWETKTGKLLKTINNYSGVLLSLTYNTNGELQAASFDRTLRLWKPEKKYPLTRLLYDFDPKEVSGALEILWGGRIEGLQYIDESERLGKNTEKYNILLDAPVPGETKIDQLVRWLEIRKAYRKEMPVPQKN